METWYKVKNVGEVDSPVLLVFPDRAKYNIELLKTMIIDVDRLRPHVKTHKTAELTLLQMEAGIRKFKCATIAEANMLGICGVPDVLLAYPLVGPKIDRFLDLVQSFPNTRFSTIVDSLTAAQALSEVSMLAGFTVPVFIDLNIGMGRTGMLPGESTMALYKKCAEMGGVSVQGFHAYDGHVREVDLAKRTVICDENFAPIEEMCDLLENEGFARPRIVIGGSPSFPIYAQCPEVECSPGTFILWDKGYDNMLPEQGFLPAVVILTRVVSMPATNRLCVDLGYKAIASENPLDNRVFFLDAPELRPVGHSEEHMVLEASAGHSWKVGDVLYALPMHICPTVALYDHLKVVIDGVVKDKWEVVARKR
ncbi:D-TA family PLP-dependent enzyme [Sphingobacterium pedocola]|uniref:Threonine aldolase n=1 Tax=Sphingobacterium pedocola TaxID=2082722 RepID=A0ABR9TEG2_9SPHI|nr:D-TA family PLP-dependent enzyme [Sphingobacterium pedocola]MBE8723264.1 threonine aldolase [Sphingobacterium pedocola]